MMAIWVPRKLFLHPSRCMPHSLRISALSLHVTASTGVQSGENKLASETGFTQGYGPSNYRKFISDKNRALQARLKDAKRYQHISEREERSLFASDTVRGIQSGKYFSIYRGLDILKGPADMAVYSQMFWHVRPRTVIELGAFTGASAIMADDLKLSDIQCNIFSLDIDLSLLQPLAKTLQPPNLTFLQGDLREIDKVLPSEFLTAQPRPMIVIDDAHENFDVVMEHIHPHLIPGDYIVCEDTSPAAPNVTGAGGVYEGYEEVGPDKLHTWKKFLRRHDDEYAIDTFFTDYFGYNSTSNWDGFARCME